MTRAAVWNRRCPRGVCIYVRILLILGLLVLGGCRPVLVFHSALTQEELLAKADLVFVGVIEKQHFDLWPIFRFIIPGEDPKWAK